MFENTSAVNSGEITNLDHDKVYEYQRCRDTNVRKRQDCRLGENKA